ncbi:MAG: hypothetical protein HN929_07860 [Chloroflexi bacterium]|jgi:predicted Holliday junction resolvase-like endonuclease|nr:hypothetical protein [Chloroflexota bacterium]MBT7081364.1 hypothetical protein [Chloroflexota bacterium]MBT7290672.1 hypothetical protein [Chloroflexota bacterium]
MTAAAYILAIVSIILAIAIVVLIFRSKKTGETDTSALEQKLLYALASQTSIKAIQDKLEGLPKDVMQSITGSLSQRTGKLNELMATFELTKYDRLFYLGEPIDFVGVKYGEGIDFIEVKTGRFRLTEDEKKLKELIDAKLVNYVPLSVERIGIAEEVETTR